jgi:hypothetical protein
MSDPNTIPDTNQDRTANEELDKISGGLTEDDSEDVAGGVAPPPPSIS